MGSTRICPCWHKYGQTKTILYSCNLLIIILFASTSSSSIFSTHSAFMAQGRPISSLIEVSDQNNKGTNSKEEGPSSVLVEKYQVIGSRPPMCERRCSTCGKCVAVQVPVVPQISHIKSSHGHSYSARGTATTYSSSRGDDLSNYKPMSWKCKCGDYFFKP